MQIYPRTSGNRHYTWIIRLIIVLAAIVLSSCAEDDDIARLEAIKAEAEAKIAQAETERARIETRAEVEKTEIESRAEIEKIRLAHQEEYARQLWQQSEREFRLHERIVIEASHANERTIYIILAMSGVFVSVLGIILFLIHRKPQSSEIQVVIVGNRTVRVIPKTFTVRDLQLLERDLNGKEVRI
jgi:ABC-type multidrug transport system fused ATPase/permease subunit